MAFPHYYSARAHGIPADGVVISTGGVPALQTAPPPEFGGPGNQWSPETLTVAAVADCMILTFKAIAGAARFEYLDVTCDVRGKLDRLDRLTSFTGFDMHVRVTLTAAASPVEARRLVEKAKAHCLITNSLKAPVVLETTVLPGPPVAAADDEGAALALSGSSW
jgi:organic hydroperoxide reductase OsmC/OhrA